MTHPAGFLGYPRPDGAVGVRNHVAIVPTVGYLTQTGRQIAARVPGTKLLAHMEGCGRSTGDVEMTRRTLVGLATNPNVAAALVLGLGSEALAARDLASAIGATGKPVEVVVLQEEGGSRRTIARGAELAERLVQHAATLRRERAEWSKLRLAVECGGSDALSGITANPAIGECADWLVGEGGTVFLSEITEMIGTDAILERRAATAEIARQLQGLLDKQMHQAASVLGEFASAATISPGNVAGGITSIQEKSLGCIIKGGTTPIRGVLPYAVAPSEPGLHIMDTPGSDIFSITGLAAAGAQIVIFSTGRGSPAGFPIAPVIKVATNTEMFTRLGDDMDLDAGSIVEGVAVAEVGRALVRLVAEVAEGRATRAESNGYDLLAIHAEGPVLRRTTTA